MEELRTLGRPHCRSAYAILPRGQMRDPYYFASDANMGKSPFDRDTDSRSNIYLLRERSQSYCT